MNCEATFIFTTYSYLAASYNCLIYRHLNEHTIPEQILQAMKVGLHLVLRVLSTKMHREGPLSYIVYAGKGRKIKLERQSDLCYVVSKGIYCSNNSQPLSLNVVYSPNKFRTLFYEPEMLVYINLYTF